MEETLKKAGITRTNGFIYEYPPVKIAWWNIKYNTIIEVQADQFDDGSVELKVIFYPDCEGIVERVLAYYTIYQGRQILGNTLIAKKIVKDLLKEEKLKLPFSKTQKAYYTDAFETSESVLSNILDLIAGQQPALSVDINRQNMKESGTMEVDHVLEHLVAMIAMNKLAFTEQNIKENIAIGIEFEGLEYLDALKNDVISVKNFDFMHYGVDETTLERIKRVIEQY